MKFGKPTEAILAHAGAGLSWACVQWPNAVGKHIVGERTEQFTPLRWHVARTHLSQLVGQYAEYPGDRKAAGLQKDFPTAAITYAPRTVFELQDGDPLARAAIGWAYGDHLLVSPISLAELAGNNDGYDFALRRGPGVLKVVAGVLVGSHFTMSEDLVAGEIKPVGELPPEVPLY